VPLKQKRQSLLPYRVAQVALPKCSGFVKPIMALSLLVITQLF